MVFALLIIGHEGVKEREVLCSFPFPHKNQAHKLCPHFSKVDVVSWESSLLVFLL